MDKEGINVGVVLICVVLLLHWFCEYDKNKIKCDYIDGKIYGIVNGVEINLNPQYRLETREERYEKKTNKFI